MTKPFQKTNWKAVVEKYNKEVGTEYEDDFEMFSELLELFPVNFISEIIGVSVPTTHKRIRELGLK